MLNLEKAEEFLSHAIANFSEERASLAIVAGYLAMFNAARAVLFKDGWREKSHACVARYLEAKHKEIPQEFIDALDKFRERRQDVQYNPRFRPTEQDVSEFLQSAKEFIKLVKKLI
ncbi:HEPN domain-containing protein [Candidatus Micrarchaeota archaeon]|nr:HEPN domain-containing protein [Candidatus Micrarchaeota archaeon]